MNTNGCSEQTGKAYHYDALIIGSGLSALHFCTQILSIQPHIKIALIAKDCIEESNSYYAQGGIAAAVDNPEDVDKHVMDTLLAGDGLCYAPNVEFIIRQGPSAIQNLLKYPIAFARDDSGRLSLAQEGGHSSRRILHSGDSTGKNIIQSILQHISQMEQVDIFSHHTAINLITSYTPHRTDIQGEVLGAYVLDANTGEIHSFAANMVLLATGGAGKTWRYTSNPMVATGDGVAMAYRAGARVGNMEFYQFHPTLLHHAKLNNFLISEAVRGEGGILLDANGKSRFMQRYAPKQQELATRDIVARAIFTEIEQSEQSFVYLDISHKPKDFLQKRFPHIFSTLDQLGIDMSKDPIPVVPAAHYQCGGVLTDVDGRTDLKRLYAVGEVAFTGLHGANRLASNSLLEAIVMAENAARCCIKDIVSPSQHHQDIAAWSSPSRINHRRASQINAHWRGLRGEMMSYAGIVRTEAGLRDLLSLILQRKKVIEEYYWTHSITRDFIELRNIILNAELIVQSALCRKESRGGHYREDYPEKMPKAIESITRHNAPQSPFSTEI